MDKVSSEYPGEPTLATFRETEGTTVIIPWENAEEFDLCSEPIARVTQNIHSGLKTVGLTVAVSQALASEAISANNTAAYYHDHISVPFDQADGALMCLTSLSESKQT